MDCAYRPCDGTAKVPMVYSMSINESDVSSGTGAQARWKRNELLSSQVSGRTPSQTGQPPVWRVWRGFGAIAIVFKRCQLESVVIWGA